LIRGEQIAKQLGAKYNPVDGYQNDICVYVKGRNLAEMPDGSYIDILDSWFIPRRAGGYPNLKIITASTPTFQNVATRLGANCVLIPQHHCNFDREVRGRKAIEVVGYIGSKSAFSLPVDEISSRLNDLGLKFVTSFSYKSREEVVEFYRNIDIQICWDEVDTIWRQPLKLANAASFGIPTVANRHIGWEDFDGIYVAVSTVDELIKQVGLLRDACSYAMCFDWLVEAAEKYHIENIAKLYKELK
jgi:hypothetical protein